MSRSAARKLIFRLGKTGFLLPLDCLVEVCEQIAAAFEPAPADRQRGIIGALRFRQTQIPVIDPKLQLGIKGESGVVNKTALIIKGAEGNWALLVDQVGELVSAEKLQPIEIPPLLRTAVAGSYSQVSLLQNEPLVHFDPDLFSARVMVN